MRRNIQVPFGYELPQKKRKGTLFYYDSFEEATEEALEHAVAVVKDRDFEKLVLYPLHEETMRRMFRHVSISSYYKREDRLHDWKRHAGHRDVIIEGWEGKRKKYTPLEAALRHLTENYPAPYFVYVTPEMANVLASFSTFEEWITQVRLILSDRPSSLHPRLEKYRHRWDEGERNET
ncbi:hypothetical protein D3C73_747960 [compost metagenome]